MKTWSTSSEEQTRQLGERLGCLLGGGEVLELIGDVGAGKTTFTKGIARGLAITDPIQSPTYTISRVYAARDGLEMRHYDFYRLQEAGIMSDELGEVFESRQIITVVEWSGAVKDILPADRLQVWLNTADEFSRTLEVRALGEVSRGILEKLM